MGNFKVIINETRYRKIDVIARNKEEALKKAEFKYYNGYCILDENYKSTTNFSIVEDDSDIRSKDTLDQEDYNDISVEEGSSHV